MSKLYLVKEELQKIYKFFHNEYGPDMPGHWGWGDPADTTAGIIHKLAAVTVEHEFLPGAKLRMSSDTCPQTGGTWYPKKLNSRFVALYRAIDNACETDMYQIGDMFPEKSGFIWTEKTHPHIGDWVEVSNPDGSLIGIYYPNERPDTGEWVAIPSEAAQIF